jgi:hypothetical protein
MFVCRGCPLNELCKCNTIRMERNKSIECNFVTQTVHMKETDNLFKRSVERMRKQRHGGWRKQEMPDSKKIERRNEGNSEIKPWFNATHGKFFRTNKLQCFDKAFNKRERREEKRKKMKPSSPTTNKRENYSKHTYLQHDLELRRSLNNVVEH